MAYVVEEPMRDGFCKFHLKDLPFDAVLHQFTVTDLGLVHDHPFGFTSFILKGGYTEQIYYIDQQGQYTYEDIFRAPGTAHVTPATCIHEIIDLPGGECRTCITPQAKERNWGFWQFGTDGSIYFREWDEPKFKPYRVEQSEVV